MPLIHALISLFLLNQTAFAPATILMLKTKSLLVKTK